MRDPRFASGQGETPTTSALALAVYPIGRRMVALGSLHHGAFADPGPPILSRVEVFDARRQA